MFFFIFDEQGRFVTLELTTEAARDTYLVATPVTKIILTEYLSNSLEVADDSIQSLVHDPHAIISNQ